jgi:hypothetical protein
MLLLLIHIEAKSIARERAPTKDQGAARERTDPAACGL